MSNPAAPRVPPSPPDAGRAEPPGVDEDAHEPNPFGPDAPNIRDDEPQGGQTIPLAPPPTPPKTPLDDDQFAPDET